MSQKRALLPWTGWAGVLVAMLLSTGCETGFDPFEESDLAYSFAGYLDASADTQFVRVSPLRQSFEAPEKLEVTVTLEEVATGRTAVLHDSLFVFSGRGRAHNFWTTMDLRAGLIYRLVARDAEGHASTATVVMPDSFPDPRIAWPTFDPHQYIDVYGVKRLVDLRMVFRVRDFVTGGTRDVSYSLRDLAIPFPGGFTTRFKVTDLYERLQRDLGTTPEILSTHVLIVSGGPDWPAEDVDLEVLALPDVLTNVEGGVGLLGGVVTKVVPWRQMQGGWKFGDGGA